MPRMRSPSVTTMTSTSGRGRFAQDLAQSAAGRIGEEQPPRSLVGVAEGLAGLTDGRGVDDRQHLGEVVGDQPVEQDFVAVLQAAQHEVLVEWRRPGLERVVLAPELLVEGLDGLGQDAEQAEFSSLLGRERGSFVAQGIEEDRVVRHQRTRR